MSKKNPKQHKNSIGRETLLSLGISQSSEETNTL